MNPVKIGGRLIGPGHPTFLVAEIGINHNGDLDTVRRLIETAKRAECDAVKFQKRTPETCVPPAQREQMRQTPWGYISYLEYRARIEFGQDEYERIDAYCREEGLIWFASCWDEASVDFMEQFHPPCYKIPSACLTDDSLLRYLRLKGRPIILSTGMSTLEQIDHAVKVLGRQDLILLHCTSTYPCSPHELNLRVLPRLSQRYDVPVGYSGHEVLLYTTLAAVALGACVVERHITLSRAMWGSDQAASVEPQGIAKLVRNIRATEAALGDGEKQLYESEVPVMRKLRRVGV
jgi:N-acetylneuraminate synthase